MSGFNADGRIKFAKDKKILLPGPTGSISLQIYGGPMARLQAGVFSANNDVLASVGNGTPTLTTFNDGKTSWLFPVSGATSYIKWRIQAYKSGGNLATYSVTVKIRDAFGNPVTVSQFSRTIEGDFEDEWIADGAFFEAPNTSTLSAQPAV